MSDERNRPNGARPLLAFLFSFFGGLWMLFMAGMMGWHGTYGDGWGNHGQWMWHHHGMMHGYGGGVVWTWIGVAAGIVILTGAIVLFARPSVSRSWGIVIIAASIIGMLAGAGGFLAGSFGLIGGVLAIFWQPPETEE